MGYGTRALHLLQQYYEGRVPSLEESTQEDDQASRVEDQVWN